MKTLETRPLRDYRLCLLDSSNSFQDDSRPSVEVLQKKYSSIVDLINDESSNKRIQLIKQRGDRKITKTIVLSNIVRQRLNRELPRIRQLSRQFDGFSAIQFKLLLKIGSTSTQKYINILLASNIIKSDGKSWASKYYWNDELRRMRL